MKIDISTLSILFNTILYIISIYYCIQNRKISFVKYFIFLLSMEFLTGLSFIVHYINDYPYFLNYIFFVGRSLVSFFLWISIRAIVIEKFTFHKNYWYILLIKFILSILIYYEYWEKIDKIIYQAEVTRMVIGFTSNYFFVILSIKDSFYGLRQKKISLKKQLKHIFIMLIYLHIMLLWMALSMILFFENLYFIRHITSFLFGLSFLILLLLVLRIEKPYLQEKKYAKSKAIHIPNFSRKEIIDIILKNKILRHSRVKPVEIATLLGIDLVSFRHLIQEKFGFNNFYAFTNELRILDALEILKDSTSDNYTAERIAGDVGFNSYTTFYRAFKKKTNKNPNDFFKL